MDRANIDKIAHTLEDKLLLAKVWDRINSGIQRNIPVSTCFLSPRELALTQYLLGNQPGLSSFGGYENAERRMLVFLPEYLDEYFLYEDESPIVCLRANFYREDSPNHRDFLGALIGAGIARECIGDICVGYGSCDFFVTSEIAPYLLQNFTSAGRTRVQLTQIPLEDAQIGQPEIREIKDTLASLRLDNVISTGFRISRSQAGQYILAAKASIDGLPCEKPDKPVNEGATVAVRGLGKMKLESVNGQTKKGRISVVIHRYL